MKILRYNAFSQRGRGKLHNEDAVLLNGQVHQGSVREHGIIDVSRPCHFAVADGVAIGTLPRMASRLLLQILQNYLSEFTAAASLPTLLNQIQQDYVALSENHRLHGMAATLVGVCLFDNKAVIFNVGDARAYLLADGQARLLSRDHSLVNDMIDNHEITPEQAIGKASILQGLTCQFVADANWDDFRVNLATHCLQPGERLILCSDGLNEALCDTQIAALFAEESEMEALHAFRAARQTGGTDDFSIIVLSV